MLGPMHARPQTVSICLKSYDNEYLYFKLDAFLKKNVEINNNHMFPNNKCDTKIWADPKKTMPITEQIRSIDKMHVMK